MQNKLKYYLGTNLVLSCKIQHGEFLNLALGGLDFERGSIITGYTDFIKNWNEWSYSPE